MTPKFENSAWIVNGPSKFDLMAALFEGKQVEFTMQTKDSCMKAIIRVQVNLVEAEDGTRDSWNLSGGIVGIGQWFKGMPQPKHAPETIDWRGFRAYFSSKHRAGSISY